MEPYVYKDHKWLKRGCTTGTCAAAAAKAAAKCLLGEDCFQQVGVMTPSGSEVFLSAELQAKKKDSACFGVRKDAGDDPDVTHQAKICAEVGFGTPRAERGVLAPAGRRGNLQLFGGLGVGRVTRAGLSVPPGEAAINPVPRKMIFDAVEEVCKDLGRAAESLWIRIDVETGEALASKTFNPHLGIEGGISILGTSGIVEPMSERALIETTRLELTMLREKGGKQVLLTPGNYGADYTKMNLKVDPGSVVKCSNFIGEALDDGVSLGFQGILLLGHIGKFVKLAAGIMNTHSRQADGRMEIFAAHAALHGGRQQLIRQIMEAPTTDEILRLLAEHGLQECVLKSILEQMILHVRRRTGEQLELGIITFSNQHGFLGKIGAADALLKQLGTADVG